MDKSPALVSLERAEQWQQKSNCKEQVGEEQEENKENWGKKVSSLS